MRRASLLMVWVALLACEHSGEPGVERPNARGDAPARTACSIEEGRVAPARTACSIEEGRAFYTEATQVTYDYQPLPPGALLMRSDLVVKGRITAIAPSDPETQPSESQLATILRVEVEHAYRGAVDLREPLYVALPRSGAVTASALAERNARLPELTVTLFMVESDSRLAVACSDAVFQLASPQGLIVASSCGVAHPLADPLFSADVDDADKLHAELLRLASPDPCRSQCPLATIDDCVEQPFERFARLEVTHAEWVETKCTSEQPDDSFPYLLEARCADGKRVLYRGTGATIERRYYTADGRFIALETAGDGGQGPSCSGSAYWPERVRCEGAVAVRVDCGTGRFAVGDRVPL